MESTIISSESTTYILKESLSPPHLCVNFSVPELVKTGGQIVVLSSLCAQFRLAFVSEYSVSKHALHRLAEFVVVGAFLSPSE